MDECNTAEQSQEDLLLSYSCVHRGEVVASSISYQEQSSVLLTDDTLIVSAPSARSTWALMSHEKTARPAYNRATYSISKQPRVWRIHPAGDYILVLVLLSSETMKK
jgi:predicted NAD/FAD-binding protein